MASGIAFRKIWFRFIVPSRISIYKRSIAHLFALSANYFFGGGVWVAHLYSLWQIMLNNSKNNKWAHRDRVPPAFQGPAGERSRPLPPSASLARFQGGERPGRASPAGPGLHRACPAEPTVAMGRLTAEPPPEPLKLTGRCCHIQAPRRGRHCWPLSPCGVAKRHVDV